MKRVYRNQDRQEICFPLGGLGSGCVSLDGTGRLRDWEIFNHPAKGSLNGFSHFGLKAERNGTTVDTRVLNADLLGPYTGRYVEHKNYSGYGYGPDRFLMAGVPHFRSSEFYGEFPLAEIHFLDESFPAQVSLEAFNPFIPSNPDDSSLPTAFFTVGVTNSTSEPLDCTLEFSLANPSPRPQIHRPVETDHFHGLELADDLFDAEDPAFGSLLFGVPADVPLQSQRFWYRGSWFDSLGVFWQDFTSPGPLRPRVYEELRAAEDVATLAVRASLAPGETWRQRFLLAWYYPNRVNDWAPCNPADPAARSSASWKNYYARLFPSVSAVAEYALAHWNRLEADTRLFHDALYASSLPPEAMEAVGANLAVLKSPTVLRLSEGQFYGFEGCQCNVGSCEGSCTHVWNYAMALPFLFPSLERSMRELDYTYNLREDGGMPFRLQLPLGIGRSRFRPCVDGQFGGVIKMYREWKLCGDDAWLRAWWPLVKRSLHFAWSPANADRWDPDRTGVISGRQHHTLDMELFGPNAWLNGFYLGALKAAAEMADVLGDPDADLYRDLFRRGRDYTDRELFNGEYYFQRVDLRDRSVLAPYTEGTSLAGSDTLATYWSDEAGQIKYQIAEGCGVDQVLAQWMCELAGLGQILDPVHVESALRAIYRHNFKPSLRQHFNPCRLFGLNDEAGLVICDWPAGREKPVVPVPYAEECMHGFEYQAASHMIRHGLEKEGLDVVRGVRGRYTGEKRNPWNEMECGSNYARSLASYALLLSFSGFTFDLRLRRLGFCPLHEGQYFWSLDGTWGTVRWQEGRSDLCVLYGTLSLSQWVLPAPSSVRSVALNGAVLPFSRLPDALSFAPALTLRRGDTLSAS